MEASFFIFKFSNQDDLIKIIKSSLVIICPDYEVQLKKIDFTVIPHWVKFYNLHLFIWTPTFINYISSNISKLLFMD